MMIAGAVGAGVLNVSRLVTASVATGALWSALPRLVRSTRVNVQFGDVNAAGSYFAMLFCLAAGVASELTRSARGLAAGSAVIGNGGPGRNRDVH